MERSISLTDILVYQKRFYYIYGIYIVLELQTSSLIAAYQHELRQVYATRAVEQSASKVAELQSKLHTQEVITNSSL